MTDRHKGPTTAQPTDYIRAHREVTHPTNSPFNILYIYVVEAKAFIASKTSPFCLEFFINRNNLKLALMFFMFSLVRSVGHTTSEVGQNCQFNVL